MTRVGLYDEISPEPSQNPSGSTLGISLGLRRYSIVYPSSRHNTVTGFQETGHLEKLAMSQALYKTRAITLQQKGENGSNIFRAFFRTFSANTRNSAEDRVEDTSHTQQQEVTPQSVLC